MNPANGIPLEALRSCFRHCTTEPPLLHATLDNPRKIVAEPSLTAQSRWRLKGDRGGGQIEQCRYIAGFVKIDPSPVFSDALRRGVVEIIDIQHFDSQVEEFSVIVCV